MLYKATRVLSKTYIAEVATLACNATSLHTTTHSIPKSYMPSSS